MPTTNITEGHRSAFKAHTSGHHDNFILFTCFLNGRPADAIIAVTAHQPDGKDGETDFHIKPPFVSLVSGNVLTDNDGHGP